MSNRLERLERFKRINSEFLNSEIEQKRLELLRIEKDFLMRQNIRDSIKYISAHVDSYFYQTSPKPLKISDSRMRGSTRQRGEDS